MRLSQVIRKHRIESGLSLSKLASRVGVTKQTCYNWESERAVPSWETLCLISNCLGIDFQELVFAERKKTPRERESRKVKGGGTSSAK